MIAGKNTLLPRYTNTSDRKFSSLESIPVQQQNEIDAQSQQVQLYQQSQYQVVSYQDSSNSVVSTNQTQKRQQLTSPTMQLSGHGGEVYTLKFSPDGSLLASAGFDKQILLWNVFKDCVNCAVFKGHTNAILELNFSTDSSKIYTSSADKSLAVWDIDTNKRIKKFTGHTSFVNSCHPARRGPELVVSGSDDGCVKVWDLRTKAAIYDFENKYPITTVSFNDTAEKIFAGGLDNQVKIFDLRKKEIDSVLLGHTDTVTGLALSHDGSYLLSNSIDQTIRCWDVRPFVVGNRCVKIYQGATHNFEKNLLRVSWGCEGQMIASGSADRFVYIWDTTTRKILHRLGGHNGSVNEVVFHPKEKIIASASSDRTLIIGDIPEQTL